MPKIFGVTPVKVFGVTPVKINGIAMAITYSSDLCTGGTPISGGDYSSYEKINAFDDNASTEWLSLQTGASIGSNSYIGYLFSSAKHIRRFTIKQENSGMTSVKLQRSSDGSSWSDVQTFTLSANDNVQQFDVIASSAYDYWRILANTNLTSGYHWGVWEVEMMEIV
jgi:hypothetical protein